MVGRRVLAGLLVAVVVAGLAVSAAAQTANEVTVAKPAPETTLAAAPADGGTSDVPQDYDNAGWMGSVIAAQGTFLGCMVKQDPPVLASGEEPDATTIFFGLLQTPDEQWTMVFAKAGGLKPNLRWPMVVSVDGTTIHEGTTVVGDKGVGLLQPPLPAKAVERLKSGAVLTIATERGSSSYRLIGSAAAVDFADRCVADVLAAAGQPVLEAQSQFRPVRLGVGATKPAALTGTAVVVTDVGHLLTNAHVVNGCSTVQATVPGRAPEHLSIVARDAQNDLALLSPLTGGVARRPALRSGVRTGELVAAYGFPFAGLLPSMGNFTIGNVTATAGLQDDNRYVQMSAPIQPGSSGGPLLDAAGNLVGVVVARLNPKTEGGGAQNVNFAIKADVVAGFLATYGVPWEAPPATQAMPAADLADAAKGFAAFLTCVPDADVPTPVAAAPRSATDLTAGALRPTLVDVAAIVPFLERRRIVPAASVAQKVR